MIALVIGEQNKCGATAKADSVKRLGSICSDIDDGHIQPGQSRVLPVGHLTRPDDINPPEVTQSSTQPRQDQRGC